MVGKELKKVNRIIMNSVKYGTSCNICLRGIVVEPIHINIRKFLHQPGCNHDDEVCIYQSK